MLLEQSNHTITFLPAGSNNPSVLSKRDIGYSNEDQPCCSKEADKRKQTKIVEPPTTSELSTTRERTNRNETSSKSLPPYAEVERAHEPIKRQNEKKAPAMKQFKEKIAKRNQKQKKSKIEKRPTIWEQLENSDSEEEEEQKSEKPNEETITAHEEKNKQNEETIIAHEEKNEQNQPKAEKQQKAEPRRGERSRNKTEFYGHNVMITNIDQSPEKQ